MESACVQTTDGVPYTLKAPFDFSFLKKYGKVFTVFDKQDSGNVCFGVEKDGKRCFVKFAGAPAQLYTGRPEDAIHRLKCAVPVYKDLAHPNLVRLVKAEEIGGGFAAVFEWVNAVCMGKQYPLDRQKFMQFPIGRKMRIFEDIMAFHAHVSAKNYVAIDFYDGSVMHDFDNAQTFVCDIDSYEKAPFRGDENLWGSTRFMSPEERVNGAVIDEVTNVYTMGATAFVLFADNDRSEKAWPLGMALFAVAQKAVSNDRGKRQQSIRGLMNEWENAKTKECL